MTRYKLSVKFDPTQPRAPAGSANGGQWVSTGGMIPRTAMPQIRSKDLPHFFNYARERGVAVSSETVKASSLQFRQAVDGAHAKSMPDAVLAKPILISLDSYVLDGNHRAAANAALGRKANVRRVALPFREAIDFMFTYPGVLNLDQAEEARKYDPSQPRAPAGSGNGGQWVPSGSAGGGYSVSDKYLAQILEVEQTEMNNEIGGPYGREAEAAAWESYRRILEDRELHQNAEDFTPGVSLYQSAYYQTFNYALRYPDETESYESIFSELEHTAFESGETYINTSEFAEQAWDESGMASVTGKSYDTIMAANEFSSASYIANDMANGMRRYAPTLPKGIPLYRSFRHRDMLANPESYVGQTFTEDGFSSTSMSAHFANRWNRVAGDRIVMRGTTDGQTRGLHLIKTNYSNSTPDPYEFEVLLPAGTSYKIKSITRSASGDLLVDVDIVTPQKPEGLKVVKGEARTLPPVELGEPNPDKFGWDEQEFAAMIPAQKFDPNQPRHPAGQANGGQFAPAGGRGGSTGDSNGRAPQGDGPQGRDAQANKREQVEAGRRAYDEERRARSGDGEAWAYARGSGEAGEGLRGLKATYEPSPELLALVKSTGMKAPTLWELETNPENAAAYEAAIQAAKAASPYGAAVYVYPTAEYLNMRLFLTPDGKSGLAIKDDGDIVSAFSSGGGAVHAMLSLAVEQGGTKLDAFDTVLPDLYAVNGFKEVGRDSWDDQYAPSDWDYKRFSKFNKGRPDVVYMEYDPDYSAYTEQRTRYYITVKYDPNQPRAPAGSGNGGQWVSPGAMYGTASPGKFVELDNGLDYYTGNVPRIIEQGEFLFADPFEPGTNDFLPGKSPTMSDILHPDASVLDSGHNRTIEAAIALHRGEVGTSHYEYRQGLPSAEGDVVTGYQTDDFTLLNRIAVKMAVNEAHDPPIYKVHEFDRTKVEALDYAIADAPSLPTDLVTYRTFRNAAFAETASGRVGKILRDSRFMSTSVNPYLATSWAGSKSDTEGLTILRIRNNGAKGLYLSRADHDSSPYEYEVLYPRQSAFRVTNVQRASLSPFESSVPVTIVDVELMPDVE